MREQHVFGERTINSHLSDRKTLENGLGIVNNGVVARDARKFLDRNGIMSQTFEDYIKEAMSPKYWGFDEHCLENITVDSEGHRELEYYNKDDDDGIIVLLPNEEEYNRGIRGCMRSRLIDFRPYWAN